MHTDVLIAGGGPAGLALGYALARAGVRVRVARGLSRGRGPIGEVLPPAIRPALDALGLWDSFVEDDHLPSAGVTFWWGDGGDYGGEWDYIYSPYGSGWHIDRSRFETTLADAARLAGVECLDGATVTAAERNNDGTWTCSVRKKDGACTDVARFVVHAAGRAPLLQDVLGMRMRMDHLVGVARYFVQPTAAPVEPRLWVEATPTGWWYTAPLPRNRIVAVFLTDGDLMAGKPADTAAQSLLHAPNTVERLSRSVDVSPLHVLPADSSRLARFTASGCLAIGDAAFTTDPVSGRGVTSAIRAVPVASSSIVDFLCGRAEALEDYDAWVESELRRYLDGLRDHYALQDRWHESPFWSRRCALTPEYHAAASV